jgi:hypothetical protein
MKNALIYVALIILIFSTNTSFGQTLKYDGYFAKIDSLASQQKARSGLELIKEVYTKARKEGNTAILIKSITYRRLFQTYLNGNDLAIQTKLLKQDVALAKQPEKSILQSLLAETLWNYYVLNRYKIGQRTQVDGDMGDDIETWPIEKILNEVKVLYLASISEVELLQRTPLNTLDGILIGDKATRYLQPTVYDLLANEALVAFRNTQLSLGDINNSQVKDLTLQTEIIFKNILNYHQKNGNTAAYCDAELVKLRFYRTGNNTAEENLTYFNSLQQLLKKSERTEIYSNVLYELALLYKEEKVKSGERKNNLQIAVELAENAVKSFPKSSGASQSQRLLQDIRALSLNITIRGFNAPDQTIDVFYESKNVDSIYLGIYALTVSEAQHLNIQNPATYYKLLNKNMVKSWLRIPVSVNDYKTHLLKDSIAGLPMGDYILIGQNRPLLDTLNERLVNKFVTFKVSGMVVSQRNHSGDINEFKVFESKNGLPIRGAKIEEEDRTSHYNLTNADGFSILKKTSDNFNTAIVILGRDSIPVSLNRSYDSDEEDEETKILLFTDRPVYRPGQEVFYKGLVLKEKLGKSSIIAGQQVTVQFLDVNSNEIKKAEQTSNEYGSFSGSFLIPNGKLNGRMEISTEFGEIEVQVEEYKRPTFELKFLSTTDEYLYNDTVRLKGSALSYSGYPIANALVKYTIHTGENQVLDSTITTDKEGYFKIAFFPFSKDKKGRGYYVRVDVTDLSGETKSINKDVTLNKGGLKISSLPYEEELFIRNEHKMLFNVSTQNNNKVKGKVKVEWFSLQPPFKLKREGLVYDTLSLQKNWKATKMPLEQNLNTTDGNVSFVIKEGELSPGYYRRLVTAVSDKLDTGMQESVFRIYDSKPDSILLRSEWARLENRFVNVGEDAIFRIAGFRDSSNVFYEVTTSGKIVKSGWLKVSPLQTIFKLPIDKSYGQFVDVDFIMVQDGEFRNSKSKIYVKAPSKELEAKFLSFRDKLSPGEQETWKIRIANKAGEHDVELLATLFDASLEAIRPIDSYPWFYKGTSRMSYPSWEHNRSRYGGQNTVYALNRYFRNPVVLRNYEKLNDYSYTFYGSPNSNFNNFLKNTDEEYHKRRLRKANALLKEISNSQKLYGLLKDPYGYGIPNVSIMLNYTKVKGSDAYGVYVIDAKVGDRITFTSADFVTNAITVKSLGRYDVNMKETRTTLNEVAIRGYVKRTRETTTGASFKVMGREVQDVPVGNVEQLLQGKVAGLNIQNNSRASNEFSGFDPGSPGALGRIIPRTNFSETAFFYPQLRPNSKGEFDIEFTIPESLTRYRMLGFAHTKAFETLFFSKELVTQKQFAISANAPRFFREGDTIVFSAKLNNMTDKSLKGNALLELRNAVTGNVIAIFSEKATGLQSFELNKNGTQVVNWTLVIPVGVDAVTYKVVAESGKYSDGEESTIPVLSNCILITEAMSLNVRGNTSKTFKMDKLLQSGKSSTMRNQSLTLEFTSNPIWNAIQALPYLMEYPYECAEQTMSRFYANSFATGILNSSPKIKQVFEEWQKSPEDSFASSLNRNASLKTLLLEETPWVRNADTEQAKMKRLATLFDLNRMSGELKANFEKLVNLQNSDGSFSWFKGMSPDRYITQHIVLIMSQLQYLMLVDEKAFPTFSTVLNKAIIYLDAQLISDFSNTQRLNAIYSTPLHYLYARSYSKQINEEKTYSSALTKALETINLDWQKMTTYEQGLAALILYRNGRKEVAIKVVNSLKERAQQSDEMGMYWPDNQEGWWWYQSPVETQALMIEVFEEVAKDATSVEELKIWLLKNKQTNEWRTTKATTAACYALLMRGYNLLEESAEPEITLGGKTPVQLGLPTPVIQAGTGYRKIQIEAAAVKADMGTVVVKNNNKGVAWGALYWQYFEQADKVTSVATGIKIKKELFFQSSTANGPLLNRLTGVNVLKKGDLITVRMEIRCDRDMEYIHLKDMRAAGFEPVNLISRYKYQDGLGYYESTKDASTNFFINYLRKGVYVFEYPMRVTHSGNFSNGVTTLQSMYAPEFTTHSEGIRVNVK